VPVVRDTFDSMSHMLTSVFNGEKGILRVKGEMMTNIGESAHSEHTNNGS